MISGVDAGQQDVRDQANRLYSALVLETTRRVVLRTPVDEGRLKGNWNVSVGSPDETTTTTVDPTGAITMERAAVAIGRIRLEEPTFLTNSLPYAVTVEYGLYPNPPKHPTGKTVDGYSRQAPAGMVGVTVAELQQLADDVGAQVRRVTIYEHGA